MLLPDSITLAVYRFNQVVAEILPALIKLAPVNEPPEPLPVIMLLATILPDAITFGDVKLIAPNAVIFKLPVDVIVAAIAVGEIIVLAITLPAVILPVYVVRNAPTFALPYVLIAGFAAKYAITFDTTLALV